MYNDSEEMYDDEYENNSSSSNKFLDFFNNNKLLVIAVISLLVLFLLLTVIGNNKKGTVSGSPEIVLKSNEIEINIDGTYIIDPELKNINPVGLTYSSSDSNIATVTSTGKVTGVNLGQANINISFGNITKTLIVVVSEGNKDVKLETISFEGDNLTLPVNYDYKLEYILEPSNAYLNSKVFSSSNSSILTIDNNGNIKTNKEGSCEITVTLNNNVTKTLNVKVSNNVTKPTFGSNLEKIEFSTSEMSIKVGNEISIPFVLTPSDFDSSNITWSLSDNSIAEVNETKLKGLKEGTVTLTGSYGDIKESMIIKVVKSLSNPTSITLKDSSTTLNVGDTYQLTPVVNPTDADKTVVYATTNEAVCTVSKSGLITANISGSCTVTVISVTDPSISASISVTVNGGGSGENPPETPVDPGTCTSDSAIQVSSNTGGAVSVNKSSSNKVYKGSKIEIYTDKIDDSTCGNIKKLEYCTSSGSYTCEPNIGISKGDTIGINLPKDKNTMFIHIKVTYDNGNSYSKKYYANYDNTSGTGGGTCNANESYIEISTDPTYGALTSISKGNSNTITSNFKVTVKDKSNGSCGSLKRIEYCTSFENNDCILQSKTTATNFNVSLPSNKSGLMRLKVRLVYDNASATKTYYANYNSSGSVSSHVYDNFTVENKNMSTKAYTYDGGLFNKINDLYANKYTIKSNNGNFDTIYLCISNANQDTCELSTTTSNISKFLNIDNSSVNYYILSRGYKYQYPTSNRKSLDLNLASWSTQTVCMVPVSSKDTIDNNLLNSKKICRKVKAY